MSSKYILRVIDFETTGFPDEEAEHSVCEIGFVDIDAETTHIMDYYDTLVVPTTDMDLTAQAVHHISFKQACQGLAWDKAQEIAKNKKDGDTVIYVAHNADFEKKFFNPEGSLWIDTYKVALKLYPDAQSHSNQFMKYFLGIEDRPHHHPPHRALPDSFVTAEILIKMSGVITFNEMIAISKEPPYLTKIRFGKHKGEKFEDLPKGYLDWLSRQSDMEPGVKAAVERVLREN